MGNNRSSTPPPVIAPNRNGRFTQAPQNGIILYTEAQVNHYKTRFEAMRPQNYQAILTEQASDLRANKNNFKRYWEKSEKTYNRNPGKYQAGIKMRGGSDFPRECHIALICYTDGHLADSVYQEFNKECRDACSGSLDLTRIANKSLFYFLRYVMENQAGGVAFPPKLHRGVGGTFSFNDVGKIVGFGQFTSTTALNSTAGDFGNSGSIIEIENVGSSRDLPISMQSHSVYSSEQEYLLSPFLLYKVDRVEQRGSAVFAFLRVY